MTDRRVRIRMEAETDWPTVYQLNRDAFGSNEEGDLVARLRRDGLLAYALVAIENDEIVGHIVMSQLQVTMDDRAVRALALAPMAVAPSSQRTGIGSGLVEAAVALAGLASVEAIIVVGHPAFYPRFGFSAERAQHLSAPFSGDAFMALELKPGALSGEHGVVVYPKAFGIDEA